VFPWLDRAGRLSPLKLVVFIAVLVPGIWIAFAFRYDLLGAKPVNEAIHETGDWAVRWLIVTLAVTPLRRIGAFPKLILVRRMLGLAALGYAVVHLCLYFVDQSFNLARIASEIVLRFYLTIGFLALLGMIALGSTSTDAAVRRLGPAWHRLHRIVYAIAVLALVHKMLQSKIDVSDAMTWTGFFLFLMGYRGLQKRGLAERPWALPGLALAAALATAAIEALWYALATGVPWLLVLEANLDPLELRPAWWVLGVGLAVAILAAFRRQAGQASGRGRRRAQPVPV
jgi:sulfoxide reductase heme-binding subunit YedZ